MTAVDRVRVGEVLRIERVPVHPDPMEEYVAIGVRSFGRGIFHYDPAAGDALGSLRFFAVNPDRLVVSNIKGWEGAIAVSSDRDAGCVASNRFLIYDAVDHAIDISWARWFFLSEAGIELIQRASPGSADRNRTLAVQRFEDLEIPLPPLDEQHRVASILDRTQTATTGIARLVERADAVASALRTSLTAPRGVSPSWQRVPLGDVLELSLDQTVVDVNGSYQIAGVYSFGRGLFKRGQIDGAQTSYRALHRLAPGQLVMSRLKAWEGAIAMVDERFDGWHLSPEFPTFNVDSESVDPDFLRAVVTAEPFWRSLGGRSKGIGARRERVNADRLLEQSIDLPPMDVQLRLAEQLRRIEQLGALRNGFRARVEATLPAALNREFTWDE